MDTELIGMEIFKLSILKINFLSHNRINTKSHLNIFHMLFRYTPDSDFQFVRLRQFNLILLSL